VVVQGSRTTGTSRSGGQVDDNSAARRERQLVRQQAQRPDQAHHQLLREDVSTRARAAPGPAFNTQADAQAYAAAVIAHKTNPSAPSPVKDWWLNTQDGTITHDPGADLKSPWMAFATQADAQAYLKAHPAQSPIQQLGSGISQLSGAVLAPLFQAHLWLRVVEVGLGLVLIAVGVAKLTNALPAATKIAKMVA
jgi:hypothetical protein